MKTIKRFCDDNGVSRSTVYNLLKRGDLTAVKIGVSTRIPPESEAAWKAALPAFKPQHAA